MQFEINLCRVNENGIITHTGVPETADGPKPECTPETFTWCPVNPKEIADDFGTVWYLREAIKLFGSFNWNLPPMPTAAHPIDFDNLRQIMNPHGSGTHTCQLAGMARWFIECMLTFPRFETPGGAIELGGADYLTASETAGRGKRKRAAGMADDFKSVDEKLADDERRECGFTRQVAAFNSYVDWVGVHAGCGRAAQGVIVAVDRLVECLRECGIRETAHIGRAAADVISALAELCRALGEAENAGAIAKGGTRADKGKKHRPRKVISGAWKSAADVADDFNRAAFVPEPGARKMGTCNEAKINRWDAKYPDEQHKAKWGYYARLRVDSSLKDEYFMVVKCWATYWSDYKADFKAWRKTHTKSPRGDYRFKPIGKRTDIDPERIGYLTNGATVVRPETDAEIKARDRTMRHGGIRRDFTHLPHSNC